MLRWQRLSLVAAFMLLPVFAGNSWSIEIKYLVIEGTVAPLQIPGDKENPGLVTEIVNALFADSDYQLRELVQPWLRHVNYITQGKTKHWIAYGIPQWMAPGTAEFSQCSLFSWQHVLITLKNSDFRYASPTSLASKNIILIQGYDYPELEPLLESHNIWDLRAPDPAAALRLLHRDRVLGYVEVGRRAFYNIKEAGLNPADFDFQSFANVIPDQDMKLMFDPGLPKHVKAFINQRLCDFLNHEEYPRLIRKYRWETVDLKH